MSESIDVFINLMCKLQWIITHINVALRNSFFNRSYYSFEFELDS